MTTSWFAGVDGSSDAEVALAWAAARASERGTTVTPVIAWEVPLVLRTMSGRRPVEVDHLGLEASAAVAASNAVAAAASSDAIGDPQVTEGHPADVLLERTRQDAVVVVGRRGISNLRHRLLGSVSQTLATHADGPVVVVPNDWTSTDCDRIVVGFDGSDHAQAALRWALSIAPDDAEITVLIAVDVIPWLSPELVGERYPAEVAAARERILAVADEVDPSGRAVRSFVLHGPRQALADACSIADLVVVGPRGLSGLKRAFLGSVTTWLLQAAPCPVAVVPSS